MAKKRAGGKRGARENGRAARGRRWALSVLLLALLALGGLAGWFYGDDLPLLVSQGLSCPNVPLRLGARSEIWLLTLRRPRAAEEWQRESAAQGPAGEVASTQNPTNAPDAGGLPDVAAMRAAQEAPLDAGESASSAPLGADDARGGAPDFFPEQISPAALPDLR